MNKILARLFLVLACLPALGLAAEKLVIARGIVIYGINADGTGLTQLSQPPAGAQDGGPLRYSPNAAKVAFQRIDVNWIAQIWVMNANGTGAVQVSPAGVPSATYSWSPDGSKLAIVANSQLHIVNADGTGLRALTAAPNSVALPSFSADGTKIAFANTVGTANSQIYVINADGTGLTNLSQTPANWDYDPAWSPDGAKIAFTRYLLTATPATSDLYVMNPDGTAKTNLSVSADASGSVWSRDGRAIAFVRQPNVTTIDLYTVPATGGATTRLTTNFNVSGEAAWASDNTRLALSSNGDIFTVNPDGTGLINITNNAAAQNLFPQYAPNPRPQQLYFIHPDHLNTPRLVADAQQRTVWRWDQGEPFGVYVPDQNPSGLGVFELPMRFPGQYFDRETNLAYNYSRTYDPGIGRYAESDPLGLRAGLNTFAYASSLPLLSTDFFGLSEQCEYRHRWGDKFEWDWEDPTQEVRDLGGIGTSDATELANCIAKKRILPSGKPKDVADTVECMGGSMKNSGIHLYEYLWLVHHELRQELRTELWCKEGCPPQWRYKRLVMLQYVLLSQSEETKWRFTLGRPGLGNDFPSE